MADNKTTFEIDLDTLKFLKHVGEAREAVESLGESKNLQGLIEGILSAGRAVGVVGAALYALKKTLDLTMEAEKIKQIENSFEALASGAGLAADVIRNDLVGASKGLADDTDLLQAANRAIIGMGASASHLGEIMDIARKSTAVFGGDLIQNFEAMNQAITNGNTKMLKQFGIVIDSDKAYRDYARSIGVSTDALSEHGKKQAILNAFLKEGNEKTKGVDESATQATQSFQRFLVTVNSLKEAFAGAVSQSGFFKTVLDFMSDSVSGLALSLKNNFGTEVDKSTAKMNDFAIGVQRAQEMIIHAKKRIEEDPWYETKTSLDKALKDAELDLEKQMAGYKDARAKLEELNAQSEAKNASKSPVTDKPSVDKTKELEVETKFQKELLSLRQERIRAEQEISQSSIESERLNNEQKALVEQQFLIKKQELDVMYEQGKLANRAMYDQMLVETEAARNAKILQLDDDLNRQRIRALQNHADHAKDTASGIKAAFALEAENSKQDLNNYGKFGKVVFNSLKTNAISAFKGMGDGSKTAGEAMKGFLFNAIADIAEAKGEMLLISGIVSNPAEAAAGAALIALSAAIRSQAGGAGGGGIGAGGGGGGGASGGVTSATEDKPEAKEEQRKSVNVQIMGNLYETEQTRTRLLDMIREATDATDFKYNQIGVQ